MNMQTGNWRLWSLEQSLQGIASDRREYRGCTSVDFEFEVSSCDVKDLRNFIAFSCSIVEYMFSVVNDAMEFQTNIKSETRVEIL